MYFYIYTQIYVKNTVLTQMTSKVGSGLFPLALLHNMNIQQPLLHATFKSVFFQLSFKKLKEHVQNLSSHKTELPHPLE